MAKLKLILESHREYDMSEKGIFLGRYSYTNPGPWTAKILEFVSDVNAKIRESTFSNNLQVTAYISKSDGPISEITFKGKKKVILYIINYYLSHSDILQDFKATIKNKVL